VSHTILLRGKVVDKGKMPEIIVSPKGMSEERRNLYTNSELFGDKGWTKYHSDWYELELAFKDLEPKSLLNVGLGTENETGKWLGFIHNIMPSLKSFCSIELNQQLITAKFDSENAFYNNLYCCDVRHLDILANVEEMDVIFWSHGPEHITRPEWEKTFAILERTANKAVILQCPWGNGYDWMSEHVSKSVRKGEFEKFGYHTLYNGNEDTPYAGILAWKIK